MIRYAWMIGIAGFALALAGCSGEPTNLVTEDPSFYAKKIKTQVYTLDQTVRRNPASAKEQASLLLEELEVYEQQPVGQHKETYAQLLQKCKELAQNPGSSNQVLQKLNEMKALADKLPGEVTPGT
jgi:DNA repair exonuclease SbcCD ATPase subunit